MACVIRGQVEVMDGEERLLSSRVTSEEVFRATVHSVPKLG
jgi:hypothetical protein